MREISIKDRFRPAVDTQGSGPTTSNFNERISKLTMKWQVELQPRRQLSDENVCFPLVPPGYVVFSTSLGVLSSPLSTSLSFPPPLFCSPVNYLHPSSSHSSLVIISYSSKWNASSGFRLFRVWRTVSSWLFNVHVKEKYLISIAVFSLLIVVLSWDLNPLHFLSILLSLFSALTAFYWRWIRFFHFFAHQTNNVFFSSVFFNNQGILKKMTTDNCPLMMMGWGVVCTQCHGNQAYVINIFILSREFAQIQCDKLISPFQTCCSFP